MRLSIYPLQLGRVDLRRQKNSDVKKEDICLSERRVIERKQYERVVESRGCRITTTATTKITSALSIPSVTRAPWGSEEPEGKADTGTHL